MKMLFPDENYAMNLGGFSGGFIKGVSGLRKENVLQIEKILFGSTLGRLVKMHGSTNDRERKPYCALLQPGLQITVVTVVFLLIFCLPLS